MNKLRTCITPEKQFVYGIHKPSYTVCNLRAGKKIERLGAIKGRDDEQVLDNRGNYPDGTLAIGKADWIFEIPNPFSFRGTTFIDQEWADASAADYRRISLPAKEQTSLTQTLQAAGVSSTLFSKLPSAVLLALATCSTDPFDLIQLAELTCQIEKDPTGVPLGLEYRRTKHGRIRPVMHNHALFEAVANNPCLPDSYKKVMVVRPGAQGGSEIVGEWPGDGDRHDTHVLEYLRRNSYIAGGHYAANMADDAIRYAIKDLSAADMQGVRHLYYQRTYIRLAELLGLELPTGQQGLTPEQLEGLRQKIGQAIDDQDISAMATLWGWNFGFDYAPSGYRLHASHQQIHQQYAEPWKVTLIDTGENTQTGGRLKRVAQYLDDEDFCFTYGDGVCDVDLTKLIAFHKSHGRKATVTAVQPPGRFGALDMDGTSVKSFIEKPHGDGMYINGGFFVLSPKVIDLVTDDSSIWEKAPLENLSLNGQLEAFIHSGFWKPMDTMRDKQFLEELWESGEAPWKVWK